MIEVLDGHQGGLGGPADPDVYQDHVDLFVG